MAEQLSIEVIAELQNFRKEMATMPGIGKQEARDMVNGIARELKRAQKATQTTTLNMSKSLSDVARVGERAFKKMGGVFGEIGDAVFDFAAPLAEVAAGMGTLGTLAAGAGGAIVGFAAATGTAAAAAISLANAASAAEKQLVEAGRAAVLPAEARQEIALYDSSVQELKFSMAELSVLAGSDLASDLGTMAFVLSQALKPATDDTTSAWTTLKNVMLQTQAVVLGPLGVALNKQIMALGEHAEAAAEEARVRRDETAAAENFKKMMDEATSSVKTGTKAVKEHKDSLGELLQSHRDFEAKRQNAAVERALSEEAAALEEAKRRQAYAEETHQLLREEADDTAKKNEQAAQDAERAWTTMLGNVSHGFSTFGGLASDIFNTFSDAQSKQIDALRDAAQGEIKAAEDAAAAWLEARREEIAAAKESGSIDDETADAKIKAAEAAYDGKVAAAQKLSEDEKALAVEAFYRAQALQKAAAVVEAARAAISMIPGFAFAGPAAPALAAAAALGALGIATAQIDAQSPPEFPTGFSPDHIPVGIQRTEGVANNRAMSDPDFADMLRRANRGERGESGGQANVHVSIDPRLQRIAITTDRRIGKRRARTR